MAGLKTIKKFESSILYFMEGDRQDELLGLNFSVDVFCDSKVCEINGVELTMTLSENYNVIIDILNGKKALFGFTCTCGMSGCSPYSYWVTKFDDNNIVIKEGSEERGTVDYFIVNKVIALNFLYSLFDMATEYMKNNNIDYLTGGTREKLESMKKAIEAKANNNNLFEEINEKVEICIDEEFCMYDLEDFIEENAMLTEKYTGEQITDIFREVYNHVMLTNEDSYLNDELIDKIKERMKDKKIVTINIDQVANEMIKFLMTKKGFIKANVDFYREDIKRIIWSALARGIDVDTDMLNNYTSDIIKYFSKESVSTQDVAVLIQENEEYRDIPEDITLFILEEVFDFLESKGLIEHDL